MADRLTTGQKLNLAVFVLKTKTRSFLYKATGLHNTMRLLAVAAALLLGFVYGMGYTQFVQQYNTYHDIVLSKIVVGIFFSVLVIIRSYFPSYKPVSFLVASYYPAGKLFKSTVNFIYDLYEPIYIYYVLFLVVFTISSTAFSFADGAIVLELLFMAVIVDRTIRIQIDHAVRYRPLILGFIFLAVAGLAGFLYWISKSNQFATTLHMLIFTVSLILFITFHILAGQNVIEVKITQRQVETDRERPGHVRILNRMYFRNSSSRQKMLLMLLFKVILVLIVVLEQGSPGGHFIGLYRYIIWSPLMVFTYVHNNYYGFFPNMWTAQRIYGDRFTQILKNYLLSLLAPLVLDLLITVLVSIYPGWVTLPDLCYYLSAFILMGPMGFYVSLMAVKKVDNVGIGTIRGNTSQIAAFVFMFCLIPLAVGVAFSWYWILLLPLVSALVLLRYARRLFNSRVDRVFSTIAE